MQSVDTDHSFLFLSLTHFTSSRSHRPYPRSRCEPNHLHGENGPMGLVRCDGTSARGPHSALDIHLLSDHLSVTFPRLCPAWSPRVLDDDADMHCWRVTGFWRGPRASSRLRQALPYMMSDMRTDGLPSARPRRAQRDLSENRLRGRQSRALYAALCAQNDVFAFSDRNLHV